jgi:hypothetical protein
MSEDPSRRARHIAAFLALAILAAACGGAPATPIPTPRPTPAPSKDPHLGDDATTDEVFAGLGRAGLRMVPNSSSTFDNDASPVVTRIYATYLDWPLNLYEFRSIEDLDRATAKWAEEEKPGKGDPPISLVGQNILVTWGPGIPTGTPKVPDSRKIQALEDLVQALEVLVGPLRAHAVVPIELASAPGSDAPSPSAEPAATSAP